MINTPELDEIIRLHGLWLRAKPIKKLNYLDQDAFEGANLQDVNESFDKIMGILEGLLDDCKSK